mgnify:CR=1 FL=1
MKNFLMRGVILVTLLSTLIFPVSASYTDSANPGFLFYNMQDFSGRYFIGLAEVGTFSVGSAPLSYDIPFSDLTTSSSLGCSINFSSSDNFKSGSVFGCTFAFPNCSVDNSSDYYYKISFRLRGLKGTGTYSSSAFAVSYSSLNHSCEYRNGNTQLGGAFSSRFNPIFSGEPKVDIVNNSSGVPIGIAFSGTLCTDLISGESAESFSNPYLCSVSVSFVYNSTPSVTNGHAYLNFSDYNSVRFAVPTSDNPGGDTSGLATFAEQVKQTSILSAFYNSFLNYSKVNHEDFASIRAGITAIVKVLSNQQDSEIRDAQAENVEQIKDDFLTGSSGGSSLGKSDFHDLSIVSSSAKDLTSLNGQASIGKFSEGLTDANMSGLGWFSADTKSALDTVPVSPTTRVPARDSDPFNMRGFSDNYNWLFGGD